MIWVPETLNLKPTFQRARLSKMIEQFFFSNYSKSSHSADSHRADSHSAVLAIVRFGSIE